MKSLVMKQSLMKRPYSSTPPQWKDPHIQFLQRESDLPLSRSHLSSLTLTEQSSGIFSSELLQVDNLSRSSSMSLKRSATHCAVSRASGSWSQHSLMVAQTVATPWRQNKVFVHVFAYNTVLFSLSFCLLMKTPLKFSQYFVMSYTNILLNYI